MALKMMSFMWLWRCCLGALLRQDSPCNPRASTAFPHTQVCGSQALQPRRWATATLMALSESLRPTVLMCYYYYYYYCCCYCYCYYNKEKVHSELLLADSDTSKIFCTKLWFLSTLHISMETCMRRSSLCKIACFTGIMIFKTILQYSLTCNSSIAVHFINWPYFPHY